MLLQDMLTLVHFITRIRVTPAAADDVAFLGKRAPISPSGLAGKLSIPTLTKLWQMLLKGLQEVRVAPEPMASAEMVLVRIAHSADLPNPSDLIRTARKESANMTSAPQSLRPASASLITTQQSVMQPVAQAMPSQSHPHALRISRPPCRCLPCSGKRCFITISCATCGSCSLKKAASN